MAGSGREANSARAGHVMRCHAAEHHNALIDRRRWDCWPVQGANQAEAQLLRVQAACRHLADAGGGCCLRMTFQCPRSSGDFLSRTSPNSRKADGGQEFREANSESSASDHFFRI